jgi:hypothetical protein
MASRIANLAEIGSLLVREPHKKRSRRRKDKRHLELIRLCCCLACGRVAIDRDGLRNEAAHRRYSDYAAGKVNPGIGNRSSDHDTVPLCKTHHESQHEGGERKWWDDLGMNRDEAAAALSAMSPNLQKMQRVAATYAMTSKWQRERIL